MFSLNIWPEVNQFVHAYLFSLKCFYWEKFVWVFTESKLFGENLSILYTTKCRLNISYWLLFLRRDKGIRTKGLIWERETLHIGCWLGRQWTLSQGIDSQTAVGCGDITFLPTWWNKKNQWWLSLNTSCLVKICPGYRMQNTHWTFHVDLFIYQKIKIDWFSNCCWLGRQ